MDHTYLIACELAEQYSCKNKIYLFQSIHLCKMWGSI